MREPTSTSPARRRLLDAALRRSPAQPLFRVRAAGRLAVLAYRGIDDADCFAEQLDRIAHTACPVSLDDVVSALDSGTPLPPRSVLLTFDDVDRTLVDRGLPLLASYGFPGVAFVVPELVGTHRPLWWREAEHLVRHGGTARQLATSSPDAAVRALWRMPDPDRRRSLEELRVSAREPAPPQEQVVVDELRRLAEGGLEIGSHTLGHPLLDRCDDQTVEAEVVGAHGMLRRWLSVPPRAFAYPGGRTEPRAERLLGELGYRAAFLLDHRLAVARVGSPHPLRISRLRVDSTMSRDRFDIVLSGLHPAVHRLRGPA